MKFIIFAIITVYYSFCFASVADELPSLPPLSVDSPPPPLPSNNIAPIPLPEEEVNEFKEQYNKTLKEIQSSTEGINTSSVPPSFHNDPEDKADLVGQSFINLGQNQLPRLSVDENNWELPSGTSTFNNYEDPSPLVSIPDSTNFTPLPSIPTLDSLPKIPKMLPEDAADQENQEAISIHPLPPTIIPPAVQNNPPPPPIAIDLPKVTLPQEEIVTPPLPPVINNIPVDSSNIPNSIQAEPEIPVETIIIPEEIITPSIIEQPVITIEEPKKIKETKKTEKTDLPVPPPIVIQKENITNKIKKLLPNNKDDKFNESPQSNISTVNEGPLEQKDSPLQKFINNEVKMLLLPNDDVVLGKINEQASLEQMEPMAYLRLFTQYQKSPSSEKRLAEINKFMKFRKLYILNKDALPCDKIAYFSAKHLAFIAANNHKIQDLKTLIDHYSVLNEKDCNGNNLLHTSVEKDHYFVAKYLLMRGIDLHSINYNGQTSLGIAYDKNHKSIISLIKKAAGY